MKQIYIDMDGVVADFDAAIFKLFGVEGLSRNADKFWKETCVANNVFLLMEPIREGVSMVRRLVDAKVPICFLTSTGGMPHHNDIAQQKLRWLHKNGLGAHPVAFCMNTKGKGQYAYPGALLIDDRQKVIDEWQAQAGCGLLFTRESASDITDVILAGSNP